MVQISSCPVLQLKLSRKNFRFAIRRRRIELHEFSAPIGRILCEPQTDFTPPPERLHHSENSPVLEQNRPVGTVSLHRSLKGFPGNQGIPRGVPPDHFDEFGRLRKEFTSTNGHVHGTVELLISEPLHRSVIHGQNRLTQLLVEKFSQSNQGFQSLLVAAVSA